MLQQRALKVIPLGTQTFSKATIQYPLEAPYFLERGEGPYLFDVDGNRFVDFISALGAIILGYNYGRVSDAVIQQLQRGSIYSLPHRLEVEVAELMVEHIPCAEMVRYAKNGSDATTGAVRVARAYTGRDKVAICGYHGWHDWYIGTTSMHIGVPASVRELSLTFKYNDIQSLERLFAEHPGEIAAVILEAIVAELPREGFLQQVKDLAHREGALLIFDEVINGGRIALGGAGEYFHVTPDLATFGKALANGLPFSMVVGRRDLMQLFDRVFFSFTFGGDTLALAAAKATVEEILEKDVIGYITAEGKYLKHELNRRIAAHGVTDLLEVIGLDAHTKFRLNEVEPEGSLWLRTLLMQETLRRGVLMILSNNLTFSHTREIINSALDVYEEVFAICAAVKAEGNTVEAYRRRINGRPIQPLFQVRRS